MHGQSRAFFQYAKEYDVFEFGSEVKKVIVSKTQKPEDAAESARKSLVSNMRQGSQMVWNLESLAPEFSTYDTKSLPLADIVFKRSKLLTDYKQLIKNTENYDVNRKWN